MTKQERSLALRVVRRSRRVMEARRQLEKAERELREANEALQKACAQPEVTQDESLAVEA